MASTLVYGQDYLISNLRFSDVILYTIRKTDSDAKKHESDTVSGLHGTIMVQYSESRGHFINHQTETLPKSNGYRVTGEPSRSNELPNGFLNRS
jgi:hypothetical protein